MMKHDWTFYDWFVVVFLALMIAGIMALFFGPPVPVDPSMFER